MKTKLFHYVALIATSFCLCLSSCEEDEAPAINPLTAKAGADITLAAGSTANLNASASSDAEGKTFSYHWAVTEKPGGSTAALANATTATPTFSADKAGSYVLRLTIAREEWTASDELTITLTAGPSAILISENITENRVLENVFTDDHTLADYIVTRSIRLDAMLTIKPGVKIAFAEDALLTVSAGSIFRAEGAASEAGKIYFSGQTEEEGFWTGILFYSTSIANVMNHVQLSHAGSSAYEGALKGGILLKTDSKIAITNSSFSNNLGFGIYAQRTTEFLAFDNNRLSDNSGAALALAAAQVHQLGNGCTFNGNNGINAIEIHNGTLNYQADVAWKTFDVPYHITEDLLLSARTGLYLAEGAVLKVKSDKMILVNDEASLHATGTAENMVKIEGMEPVAGYWRGLYIQNSGGNVSELNFVSFKHAGSTPLSGDRKTSIQLGINGMAAVKNSLIADGAGDGFDAYPPSAVIESFEGNTIQNHVGYPLVVSTNNTEVLDYNTHFAGNGKAEVRVDPGHSIQKSSETTWKGFAEGLPYLIAGTNNNLIVHSGFRLEAGVVLKFQENIHLVVIDANGHTAYLKVAGTAAKNVVLQGAKEMAGSWYGITISSDNAENYINYARILHGGKTFPNSFSASIVVDNSPTGRLSISNSFIGQSGQHGISVAKIKREYLLDQNLQFESVPASGIYVWE